MLREAGVLTEGNLYDIFNVSVVHHVQQACARIRCLPATWITSCATTR